MVNVAEDFFDIEAKVSKLYVNGVKRTKPDVISKIIKSLFYVKTFKQLLNESAETRERLIKFGAFKNVVILIDKAKNDPTHYSVTFQVEETSKIGCGVHTLVGNNEASLNTSLNMPNLFCGGENFSFNASYNTQKFLGFAASLMKPFYFGTYNKSDLSLNLFNNSMDFHWADLLKLERGFSIMLQNYLNKYLSYSIAWEVGWRTALGKHDLTPFTIREQYGHSLKSSIKHILHLDTRDNPFLPNTGLLAKVQQEYAGMGGDTNFTKTQLDLHQNIPFRNILGSVIQLTFSSGFIVQNGRRSSTDVPGTTPVIGQRAVHMMDKFYVGGPLNFRGFSHGGMGPHVEGAALGVDFYWLSGVHLYNPLPFISSKNNFFRNFVRSHVFANFGNFDTFHIPDYLRRRPEELFGEGDGSRFNGSFFNQLYNKMRLSMGCGLVLNFGNMARCEINYCLYTRGHKDDKIAMGLQAGVGIDFT